MSQRETASLADEMAQRVRDIYDQTWIKEPQEIAQQLHAAFRDRVEGLTPGMARQFTEEVLKSRAPNLSLVTAGTAAPTAGGPLQSVATAKANVNDVARRIVELNDARYTRGQIAEILREELAPGAQDVGSGYFRKMTDLVLGQVKASH